MLSSIEQVLEEIQRIYKKSLISAEVFFLFFSWILKKLHLLTQSKKISQRRLQKGGIYWCYFGFNIGSEFSSVNDRGYMRPCLVVKNNIFSASQNTIVIPLTTYLDNKKIILTDVVVHPSQKNKLTRKSIIKVSHLRDVSIWRIGQKIGQLNEIDVFQVEEKLCLLLDIKKNSPENESLGESPKR